jgi:hypothetical protein
VLLVWTPNAFERHGGLARARRWRSSIKVQLPDNQRVGLGPYLERCEAQQLQEQLQVAQRQEQLLLLAQQHTLKAACAQQAGWQWRPLQVWLTDEQMQQGAEPAAHAGSEFEDADPPPSIVSGVLGRLAQWAGPVGSLKRPPPDDDDYTVQLTASRRQV